MLQKHSVTINGHSTSFSLEPEFYNELKHIAAKRKRSLSSIITQIDTERDPERNLSSALRVFILDELKNPQ